MANLRKAADKGTLPAVDRREVKKPRNDLTRCVPTALTPILAPRSKSAPPARDFKPERRSRNDPHARRLRQSVEGGPGRVFRGVPGAPIPGGPRPDRLGARLRIARQ